MRQLKEHTKQFELGRLMERSEAAKRKLLVEAWAKSGQLHGLKGRDLGNMAVLAENQKAQLLKEQNTSADMNVFDAVAIPMIRRQNRLMVTPNLISTQPLSYPQGLAFFMDYNVSSTKEPIKAPHHGFSGNSFESVSGYDRHYNNQGYDNTKGKVIYRGFNPNTVAFDNSGRGGINDTANAAAFSANGIDLGTGAGVTKIQVVDFDLTSIGGITMDQVASLTVHLVQGGAVVKTEGKDYFVQRSIQDYTDYALSSGRTVSGGTTSTEGRAGGPGDPNKVLRLKIIPATPNIGTVDLRLEFKQYLNLELNAAFSSEMRLSIKKIQIDTQIHKMKAAWTVELAQDLMAYHAVDVEAEITQMMAEETAQEKDRMIINELITLAGHFELWDADFANAVNPNPANTVFRGTEGDYNQTLMYAINRLNGKIQKSTKRGGANWVLISAEGAAKFYNMDVFRGFEGDEEGTKFAAGVERIGSLQKRFDVFVDPNLPAEICLLGRKGTSFFDTGYVYCPYIEYMLSPTIYEDQDFQPRRQISSRFGTAMLNNKFYGVLYMKGIESFGVTQEATGELVY